MSKAAGLNALYAAYIADPLTGIDPLLAVVRKTALRMMRDEDAVQAVLIDVWGSLPTLKIKTSFAAYLHLVITWRRLKEQRRAVRRAGREQQAPLILDSQGNQLSDEESLSRLMYESDSRDSTPDPAEIDSPFIRTVAEMLLDGFNQAEIAWELQLSPVALRVRLHRHRHEQESLLAA